MSVKAINRITRRLGHDRPALGQAWYGDRTSLWLPDTLGDFNEIYDNYNQTGILVITPATLGAPASTLTSGEYKDWLPFVSGGAVPEHFPLSAHAPGGAGQIEYFIWGRPVAP